MKKQQIKNPDSPGGRKDWEGRTPRVRISMTHAQIALCLELVEAFINSHPDRVNNELIEFRERLLHHNKEIQKPLTETIEDFGLFG